MGLVSHVRTQHRDDVGRGEKFLKFREFKSSIKLKKLAVFSTIIPWTKRVTKRKQDTPNNYIKLSDPPCNKFAQQNPKKWIGIAVRQCQKVTLESREPATIFRSSRNHFGTI